MDISVSAAEIDDLMRSGEFDASWYASNFPDVETIGMDPAIHYLWLGKKLGRPGRKPDDSAAPPKLGVREGGGLERCGLNGLHSIDSYLKAERESFLLRLRSAPQPRFHRYRPLISILLPTYKSPINFLDAAIKSVVAQSYDNWELMITDDGSNQPTLNEFLRNAAKLDSRIKIQINDENRGISAATNDSFYKSSGEFVGLFDHDDILTLDALDLYVDALNKYPALDLIYSDECRVDEQDIPIDMFRKPDWSPAMLQNYMYTGHFSVYRRDVVERVGGFRTEYDFSQDYDLALRVTELTSRVHHIPQLIYGWRAIAGSGAAGGKDFARETNISALQDAMRRRGINGTAVPLPTANRVDRRGHMPRPLVSIIIPSDNRKHIEEAIQSIVAVTDYPHYEIVVVTNSRIISEMCGSTHKSVVFAPFDKKFNFSAKCNVGADASSGDFYCFFNDDVRPQNSDWIDALLEVGLMSDVGAVGAKLLYENGTIQHAGMITGVRNLIGTAFHCLPSDTSHHFNMAQCVRDVTLLCGALILMKRAVFQAIGGWNEDSFAIAHSDTDLCLKVWSAGMRCVYTPYAQLLHIGHVSIGQDEKNDQDKKKPKAKGEIALLRRWPTAIASDPYFTYPMVRSAYHDSQELFRVFPGDEFKLDSGSDVLIACHELTRSGAPLMAFEMARHLKSCGHFVTIIAPEDGAMRQAFNEIGITVIVDELLFHGHHSVLDFCRNFDVVIANTVVTWPLVKLVMNDVAVKWYIHESAFLESYLEAENISYCDIDQHAEIWAVSSIPGSILSRRGWQYKIIPPGVTTTPSITAVKTPSNDSLNVMVLGGYEPRKGQDLSIAMLDNLSNTTRAAIRLKFHGRTVDCEYYNQIAERVGKHHQTIELGPELGQAEARAAIRESDILLVPSRDESFSLVVVEALQQGVIVVCSRAVGISEFLEHGKHVFIADSPAPNDLANALETAVSNRDKWDSIRAAGARIAHEEFSDVAFKRRLMDALAEETSN